MVRNDGRFLDQLRPVDMIPRYLPLHPTSCLIRTGLTWVMCAASVDEKVPPFLEGKGQGWVTAEYCMMPASGKSRTPRERQASGRSQEISRLIGRALRGAVDLTKLGPRTIIVDCDVLQADGGTRTASITGGYVALVLAVRDLIEKGLVAEDPLGKAVAAVSAGMVAGQPMLDLDYSEDSKSDVDLNVVMNAAGEMIEVQGTAEGRAFGENALQEMLSLARKGIKELLAVQRSALGDSVQKSVDEK